MEDQCGARKIADRGQHWADRHPGPRYDHRPVARFVELCVRHRSRMDLLGFRADGDLQPGWAAGCRGHVHDVGALNKGAPTPTTRAPGPPTIPGPGTLHSVPPGPRRPCPRTPQRRGSLRRGRRCLEHLRRQTRAHPRRQTRAHRRPGPVPSTGATTSTTKASSTTPTAPPKTGAPGQGPSPVLAASTTAAPSSPTTQAAATPTTEAETSPASGSGGELSHTGFDAFNFALVALTLMSFGAVLIVAGRRRRPRTSP